MSYSCGKDSTLALYRMIKKGYNPVGLLVTVDKNASRSWFHGISKDLLNKVSHSLNIPLLLVECEGIEYEEEFNKALIKAKENLDANICVFGDIDLEAHRTWCTDRCNKAKIEAVFPLWNEDREKLTYEFIDEGFKAIIKKVKLEYLNEGFLGKVLNYDLVQDIKKTGADPCGENGEYHTFVYDGPLFKYKVNFKTNGNKLNKEYGFLDIEGNKDE
ncbi:Dph6-related ATP pyrophosphatase [Clostridium carnis]